MPDLKPFTYTFASKIMNNYRKRVWEHVDNLNLDVETFDNIYVSRKMAKNRMLVNDQEVLDVFSKFNFKEVCFEEYTFFEQVYLMKNCKVLAGVHGAGFANVCFMPENAVLLEMIKEYSSYKEERPSYWRLCSAIDISYYIQYCKPVEYGDYDLWVGVDLIVDIKELESNMKLITINS